MRYEDMNQAEAEEYLDNIEMGTYTCKLILTKYDEGLGIEIQTEEVDEIVKTIISFAWTAALDGEDFSRDDNIH